LAPSFELSDKLLFVVIRKVAPLNIRGKLRFAAQNRNAKVTAN